MTTTQQINLQLPTPNTAQNTDCPIPFLPNASPKLQQQAQKVENAAVNFSRTTFDNLLALGDTGIDLSKKFNEELGEGKGKSAFNNWLESVGASKYVLRLAMKMAERYSNLKPRVQKLLRDKLQRWGLRALKDLFSVGCDKLLEALVRTGTRSHRAIKNIDGALEGKKINLPDGGFIEVTVDDERNLKGKIGIIDSKDKDGNIVVRLIDTGKDVTLKSQDVTRKTPKSVNQCLVQVIEELHQESLEKDLKLNEYQSVITSEPTTEVLEQSERDRIAASAIAAYKEEQAQKEAALHEQIKAAALSEVRAEYDAALADANAQIKALHHTSQKLAQQLEDKERLTQVIEDLRCQLKEQVLRAQQVESQNQQLQQQVAEFQLALAGTVEIPDNINKQECSTIVSSVVESSQLYNEPARSPEIFPSSELNDYKADSMELPADYIKISQAEFILTKKKLEDSESLNLELAETIEVLRDVINIMKTEQAEKEWEQNIHKIDKQLGKMSSRPAPRGFSNVVSRK